ncbi:MAG: VOC family protein [Alphaproteobacteria bacterium]|nr:VOC family protein [Alphaproteobacteria bacterium]
MITVKRLDHFVMTVRDVEATCRFYERVLGMTWETFGPSNQRVALKFGDQKINLHPETGNDIGYLARVAQPGTEDLCFITEDAPEDVIAHLKACGVTPLDPEPVARTGALGPIRSVYFRDPDGNLIEVSSYSGS